MKRLPVLIEMVGMNKENPLCHEPECGNKHDCANHSSAGQFREESGFTPDLERVYDTWTCTQEATDKSGMLVWSESQGEFVSYDIYDVNEDD